MRVGDLAFDSDIFLHAACVLMYVHKYLSAMRQYLTQDGFLDPTPHYVLAEPFP